MKIVKIGGNVIDNPVSLNAFLNDFASLNDDKILVHGGGKIATQISKSLGIETQMVQGRRVTDKATLDVVTMVYAGLINKNIVATLQSIGCDAVGLSGADCGAIQAHKRQMGDIDYGFVGDVDQVNGANIKKLILADFTPVFCAITHDGQGSLLNTNADTIATEVAIAMALGTQRPTELIFCFEKNGVLSDPNDDSSVIQHINSDTYKQLLDSGVISGGMIPKLQNAFAALDRGVAKVIIASPEYITDQNTPHTEIVL